MFYRRIPSDPYNTRVPVGYVYESQRYEDLAYPIIHNETHMLHRCMQTTQIYHTKS